MNRQLQFDDSVNRLEERRLLTPANRLIRRIKKEFTQKILIGDILINEHEYEILIEYFKTKCFHILKSGRPILEDPVFATALVQIGIHEYNGNFWGHISRLLGRELNANVQLRIGDSFVATLQFYDKLILDKNERVNNILLHGFVSNHYAFDLFEFLFKFYNLDLERDLDRNSADMMNNLMEITQRNDNTGRTHLLVRQTANALAANPRGGKIRIRRLLRLMDRAFWEQYTPANPVSRLTVLFTQWVEQSEEFQAEYRRIRTNVGGGRGRKSFSSPYFYCDYHRTEFTLKFPKQLIHVETAGSVQWRIRIGNQFPRFLSTDLIPAITGYKTEEMELTLRNEDLFESYELELLCDGERARLFKIKSDCIRFFDSSGVYLPADSSLPKGKVYAFTRQNETPISEALVENEPVRGLVRSYFEFELGDIVRLPDGKAISIGKRIEEGLLMRKQVDGVSCIHENQRLPVYAAPPSVLLKIPEERANGTLIEVNGQRHRLFDELVTVIDLADRTGETGYLLNLGRCGCTKDGIYQVYIDVPNDRTNRFWQFALIQECGFEFEDAPYIFQSKGTIRFPSELSLQPIEPQMKKNTDENSYNFEILPEQDELSFRYEPGDQSLELRFEIPTLQWKFDHGPWQVEKPEDIWHAELPRMTYLKYPGDRLAIAMDEEGQEHEDDQEQRLIAHKSRSKGWFECDMTRVRSWLGRDQVLRLGYLELPGQSVEFLRIITRSVVTSCFLRGNYQADQIVGELMVVGKSQYFVDVWKADTNEQLAEKLQVREGTFTLPFQNGSGRYKVNVFEAEEDDTGFGLADYLLVGTFEQSLTNPYDLRGKSLKIRSVKKGRDSLFQMSFNAQYEIRQLSRISDKDKHRYAGKLVALKTQLPPMDVVAEFPDLERLQFIYLQFHDGYDDVEFLYDRQQKFLVKSEQKGLTRAVRYRRYESLYPEDFVFVVEILH